MAHEQRERDNPVPVNTSFSVRGEAIGKSKDALGCFIGCELDVLAIRSCYLRKGPQDAVLGRYGSALEPDE